MAKILRASQENRKAQFPILSVFVGQKSIIHYYRRNSNSSIYDTHRKCNAY